MSSEQKYSIKLTSAELEYLYFLVENESLYSDKVKTIFNEIEAAYHRMKDNYTIDRQDPNRRAFIERAEQY
jgi:hypothetical protein